MKAKTFLTAAALALCCTFAASAQTDSTFFIDGSMGRLSTRLQLPELQEGEKCPVVVICHGFMGNKNEPLLSAIAENLVELGIGAIRCDFNGHGQSEGEFVDMTVLNEIDDALAVIDYVRRMPQTDGISILGHSQGGVVAAMTAGQLGSSVLKSAVLMAPAAVLRDDALRGSTMGATSATGSAATISRPPSACQSTRPPRNTTAPCSCSMEWPTRLCPTPTASVSAGRCPTARSSCCPAMTTASPPT